MTKEEEILLISKIKSGETHLYKELVESHSSNVFNLIRGIVSSREDAEEIAQDVFVKAYFSLKNFRGECSFSTWLYKIAYNMSISKTRRKKREFIPIDINGTQIISEDDSLTELKSDHEEMFKIIQDALLNLDSKDKFLVISFYMHEKSIKDLKEITGLSESNVKVRLHRSKKRLSQLINDNRELSYG